MENSTSYLLIIFAVLAVLTIIPTLKILKRMGYSGWWSLTIAIPPVLIILLWIMSFQRWPVQELQAKTNIFQAEYISAGDDMSKSSWSDKVAGGFGCLMMIAFLGYGLTVLAIGWIGIEKELGWWWAFGASTLAILLRFTIPISVGAIYGAMYLWDWHWALATLFALPGLAFMIPALLAALIGGLSKR